VRTLLAVALTICVFVPAGAGDTKPQQLFDGKSLAGWTGDKSLFRLEDGAIVGGMLDNDIPHNYFLTHKSEFADFELRVKFKLIGESTNAGVQIRSRRIPNHHEMIGYQADLGGKYWGALYDESRRRKVLQGPKLPPLMKVLKTNDWNDYRIRCEGRRIQLWINGLQTVDYTEDDADIEQTGLIGLQIHGGKAGEAWYKDIVLVKLGSPKTKAAPTSAAAAWPQFRGPGSQGASTATDLPSEWNNDKNLAWRTKLPGAGASSPIALGDRLYLTCYSGYGAGTEDPGSIEDLQLHFVCVDANSGNIVFDKRLKPTMPETDRVRDHGYAAATPATDGEHVWVFFGKSGVVCFDLNGNQKWRQSVGDSTHKWGCGTSPVLFEDLVIVNASVESGSLVALNKKTGKEVWRAPGMKSSWNTPHLIRLKNGTHELCVNIKGSILGYDPATGEQLWTCDGIPDYICPSIISQDGILYAIGGRTSRAIAVRAGGRGDVTASHKLWEATAGANVSSPVIHDGHMYWVSDRNNVAYCLDVQTGELVYQQRFSKQPYASTLLADGKLYVTTRFNGTFVLAAKPKYELLAHNEFDDESTFNASPIVANGKLLIRSNRYLYCVAK
jgi:outer membrane protein assembly factor BamB